MNKMGVIFCCYGNPEYVKDCILPWINLKQKYNIKIAAVHGQFKEYHDMGIPDDDKDTMFKLMRIYNTGLIDHLFIKSIDEGIGGEVYKTESELRDECLQALLKDGVDYVWLLDLDEFYTEKQIETIIEYINREDNLFYTWFSIPFKNYLFDGKQWVSGFCPPRIFRANNYNNLYKLDKFYWDNDIQYLGYLDTVDISYKDLPNKSIPENLLSQGIKHLTWLHSNGEKKCAYQEKHFNGICSYKFDKEKGELYLNPDYYKDKPYPTIHKDE